MNLPTGEAESQRPAPSAGTGPAIQCKYSCFKCGVYRQVVTVRARLDTEDVKTWLEQIAAAALSRDHDHRSPGCRITKLDEVMIPIYQDNPKIGGAGTVPANDSDGSHSASPEVTKK